MEDSGEVAEVGPCHHVVALDQERRDHPAPGDAASTEGDGGAVTWGPGEQRRRLAQHCFGIEPSPSGSNLAKGILAVHQARQGGPIWLVWIEVNAQRELGEWGRGLASTHVVMLGGASGPSLERRSVEKRRSVVEIQCGMSSGGGGCAWPNGVESMAVSGSWY